MTTARPDLPLLVRYLFAMAAVLSGSMLALVVGGEFAAAPEVYAANLPLAIVGLAISAPTRGRLAETVGAAPPAG